VLPRSWNKTWTFWQFATRLVRDSITSPWFRDTTFWHIRRHICGIFTEHHFTPALDISDYCFSSGGIEGYSPPILPVEFNVSQNYPNPFNGATWVAFSLPFDGDCMLEIFNILGQRIWHERYDNLTAGKHAVFLSTERVGNLASGIYTYRISINGLSISKKMLIIK